jgi:hypothetical protein
LYCVAFQEGHFFSSVQIIWIRGNVFILRRHTDPSPVLTPGFGAAGPSFRATPRVQTGHAATMPSSSAMGPLQLPLSLLIGGWPTPSIPPSGGGTEHGSSGPPSRGSPWQRQLRAVESPPFEFTSPPQRAKRRTGSNFFKPAGISSSGSALGMSPRPPPTAPRLPEAPSTGSISHRPSEFLGATAPRRRPPRLSSGYPSPMRSLSARHPPPSSPTLRRPDVPTRKQKSEAQHKLWDDMRQVRHAKQRESEMRAYRFAFDLIDSDGNTTVEAGEVLTLLKTMGRSATVEGGFWAAFNELDCDKSNGLDFREFCEVLDRIRGNNATSQILQAGNRVPQGGNADSDDETDQQNEPGAAELTSRRDGDRAGAGQIGAAMPATKQRFSQNLPREPSQSTMAQEPSFDMAAERAQTSGLSRSPSTVVGTGNGSMFMSEAIELRRQLLDVYCAVDIIRETSLKTMIVEPYEDSRVRTETGRGILNEQLGLQRMKREQPRAHSLKVHTDSFEDLSDLAISATGGVSNQKDKKIEQDRRHLRRNGEMDVTKRTRLAVRSTYAKNAQSMLQNQYAHLPLDAQEILDQFMRMFEATMTEPLGKW